MSIKHIRKTFQRAINPHDSARASLASVAKYHGGIIRFTLAGEDKITVADIYRAAAAEGFSPEAYQSDVASLKKTDSPVILQLSGKQYYYAVCYSFQEKFLVGDPSCGLTEYSEEELTALWPSQILLKLTPNEHFVTYRIRRSQRYRWLLTILFPHRLQWIVNAILYILTSALFALNTFLLRSVLEAMTGSTNLLEPISWLVLVVMLLIALCYVYRSLVGLQVKTGSDHFFSHATKHMLLHSENTGSRERNADSLYQLLSSQYHLASVVYRAAVLVLPLLVCFILLTMYSTTVGLLLLISAVGIVHYIRGTVAPGINPPSIEHDYFEQFLVRISLAHLPGQKAGLICQFTEHHKLSSSALSNTIQQNIKRQFVFQILSTIAIAGFLLALHYLYQQGRLDAPGGFMVLSLAAIAVMLIYRLIRYFYQAQKYLSPVTEFYSDQVVGHVLPISPENTPSFTSFAFQQVTLRRSKSLPIENINLSVQPQKLLVVHGSGASDLFEALRERKALFGKITFNGQNWQEMTQSAWQAQTAFVGRKTLLINGTLAENIVLSRDHDEVGKFLSFCNKYEIHRYFSDLPQGYATPIRTSVAGLTLSHRQLIGLLRVLYQRPQLLFLHEPTAYFDDDTEAAFFRLLHRVKDQTSIIVFTSKSHLLPHADRVCSLSGEEKAINQSVA